MAQYYIDGSGMFDCFYKVEEAITYQWRNAPAHQPRIWQRYEPHLDTRLVSATEGTDDDLDHWIAAHMIAPE